MIIEYLIWIIFFWYHINFYLHCNGSAVGWERPNLRELNNKNMAHRSEPGGGMAEAKQRNNDYLSFSLCIKDKLSTTHMIIGWHVCSKIYAKRKSSGATHLDVLVIMKNEEWPQTIYAHLIDYLDRAPLNFLRDCTDTSKWMRQYAKRAMCFGTNGKTFVLSKNPRVIHGIAPSSNDFAQLNFTHWKNTFFFLWVRRLQQQTKYIP